MPDNRGSSDRLLHEDLLHLTSIREIVPGFLHEISQPLNAISLAGQLLDLKLSQAAGADVDTTYLSEKLGVITEGVQRTSKIMEDLRSFNDHGAVAPKESNLREAFDKIFNLMTRQFINREVTVRVESEEHLPALETELRLAQCTIVQCLAFSRDCVLTLATWHADRSMPYDKTLNVELAHAEGSHIVTMAWHMGEFPPDEPPIPLETGSGLKAAELALEAKGSRLEVAPHRVQAILAG
jgi:hypothetical protein